MKKILIIVCAVAMLSAMGAFAERGDGVGLGVKGIFLYETGGATAVGAMATIDLPGMPVRLGVGFNTFPAVRVAVDYLFAEGPIVTDMFGWYVGVGAYMSMHLSPQAVMVGGRIPLGLRMWLGNNFEFFTEAEPGIGVNLSSGFSLAWEYQHSLGVRFWF